MLGDDTPRSQGRVTLNPIAHIDPIGTLLVPGISILLGGFALIGWGKPVMIDPRQFRNFRRDDTLVSMAGPASNLILAAIVLFACRWLPSGDGYRSLGVTFAYFSIFLAVFNLIPIPPLDGWHPIKNLFRIPDEFVRRGGIYWYVLLLFLIQLTPVRIAMRGATDLLFALIATITVFN